jgi:hypothetical protein
MVNINLFLALSLLFILPTAWGALGYTTITQKKISDTFLGCVVKGWSLGILGWSLFCLVAFYFNSTIWALGGAYVAAGLCFFKLSYVKYRVYDDIYLSRLKENFGLLFVLLVLGFSGFIIGSYQDMSADTIDHIAFVQRAISLPFLSLDIYTLSSTDKLNLLVANYAYNSIHILYAFISALVNIDPIIFFFHAVAVMLPLFFLACLYVCQSFFKDNRLILFHSILILIFFAFFFNVARTTTYPNIFGFIISVVILSTCLKKIEFTSISNCQNKEVYFWCSVSSCLLFVHPQWWFYTGMGLFFFSIKILMLNHKKPYCKMVAMSAALLFLFSLPFALIKYAAYSSVVDDLGAILAGRYINDFYDFYGFNGYSPKNVFSWVDVTLLVICLSFVLFFSINKKNICNDFYKNYCFSVVIFFGALILLLFPPFFHLLSEFVTINLMVRLKPYFIDFWVFICCVLLLSFAVNSTFFRRFLAVINDKISLSARCFIVSTAFFGFLFTLLFFESSYLSIKRWVKSDKNYETIYGPLLSSVSGSNLKGLLDVIPSDAKVLSDLPGVVNLMGIEVVYPFLSFTEYDKQVQRDVATVLDVSTSENEFVSLLSKYNPDFVLISPRNSNVGWMKLDSYSSLNKKSQIYHKEANYFNKQWVLYEVDKTLLSQKVNNYIPQVKRVYESPLVDNDSRCFLPGSAITYNSDIDKTGWAGSDELLDLSWVSTSDSVLWLVKRLGWFYLEFKLSESRYVDDLDLIINNFSSSYNGLSEIRMYIGTDDNQWILNNTYKMEPYVGVKNFTFNVSANIVKIRLALKGKGNITLSEVRFLSKNCNSVVEK